MTVLQTKQRLLCGNSQTEMSAFNCFLGPIAERHLHEILVC